jgi:dihydrodipicolinate synthase/N-acetylneuraminate lyase
MTMPATRPAACRPTAETAAGTLPRFHGIVPPLVTPLRDADTLDVAGLERLVEHVVGGGVHGLFILGTTGEGPSLATAVQQELVGRVVRLVDGRVPVLVGITDASPAESVALARCAAERGADAVVAAPPFYFPAAQEPLVRWGRDLAARVPLPLLLYNMPEMTKHVLEPDTIRRLADCPNIVGVKDSGGDLGSFADVVGVARAMRPDWSLFVGPELLLPEAYELGGHGAIPGGANVMPQLFADLDAAVRACDTPRVETLRGRARQLARLYDVGEMPGRIVVGIKMALSIMGICEDAVASAFERFGVDQRRRITEILAGLAVGMPREA